MSKWLKIPMLLIGGIMSITLLAFTSLWLLPRLITIEGVKAPEQQNLAITSIQVWQGTSQNTELQNPEQSTHRANFVMSTVLINQGRFQSILPKNAEIPLGYTIVDGRNFYMLPGFVDAHAHILDSAELSGYLARGVTTVRNMNGRPMHLQMKNAWQQGELMGARLITAGPTLNHKAPSMAFHQNINSTDEAVAAVQGQKAEGYDWIKIYDGVTPELFQAVIAAAANQNMPVAGHLPSAVGIEDAITGLNSLEHVDELWQNGITSEEQAEQHLLASTLAQSDTALVTSLAIMQRLATICGQGLPEVAKFEHPGVNPLAGYFGVKSLSNFADGSEGCEQFQNRVAFLGKLLLKIHSEKATLVLGSDQGPHLLAAGDATMLEAAALNNIGLSIEEVIHSATEAPALMLRQEHQLGQIKAGYLADAVIFQKDPMQTPAWQQKPSAVMVEGRWYDETQLLELEKASIDHSSFWLTLSRFLQ